MQCLSVRQAPQMIEEAVLLLLEGRVRLDGDDPIFALPHGVSIGFNFRRPVRRSRAPNSWVACGRGRSPYKDTAGRALALN
jgi:hypothetical protein